MKVFKIALTGGPCAGKSTMYSEIQKELKKKNYKVLSVDETARQLILRGLLPNDENYVNLKKFQNMVYYYQKTQENCAYDALEYNTDQDICIILCDRGLLDNKAYLNDYKDFDEIVRNNYDKELKVLDSYDLVLYLITLAISKPSIYGQNDARYETREEAAILDTKTKQAWVGHHNLKTINTNMDVSTELNNIMLIINDLIHNNQYKENEVEYDIASADTEKYTDNDSRSFLVKEQGLIDKKNGNIYRVYQRTYKGISSILLSINDGNTRQISYSEYENIAKITNILYSIEYEEIYFVEFNQIYRLKKMNDSIKLYIKERDKQIIPSNIITNSKIKSRTRKNN